MGNAGLPELSVVVTIYNAEAVIKSLLTRIIATVESMRVTYEIILVDDGSKDDSVFIMEDLASGNLKVKSVMLSRNFGQQIAMSAGIHFAKGNYVLIMDGDLQNPPEAIPALYEKAKAGYDVVYTASSRRNNVVDTQTSWLFWRFLKSVMKIDIVRSQLMMRMLNRRVANYFCRYPEKIRTIAAITHDIGMKFTVLSVENEKRVWGKSSYNTIKRLSLAIDVLIDLSNHPLNILFYLGLIIFCVTGVAFSFYLYLYISESVLPGFTSMILAIMFFGSVNLISLGVIARYVSNIYTEVKQRPLFLVRKTVNTEEPWQ